MTTRDTMHNKSLTGMICLCIFATLFTTLLNILLFVNQRGLFQYSLDEILDEFSSSVTPPKWAHAILGVIFLWLGASLCYLLFNVHRNKYDDPAIFSGTCGFLLALSMVVHTAGIFVMTEKNMVAFAMFKLFEAITSWILVGIFSHRLNKETDYLKKQALWLHRLLPQNGIVAYACWTTVAAVLDLSMAINCSKFKPVVMDTDETVISFYEGAGELCSLVILSCLLFSWIMLENFAYYKTFQYVFTPYPVLVWALTGIYLKLQDSGRWQSMEAIFVETLLVTGVFIIPARLAFIAVTHYIGHPIKRFTSSTYLLPVAGG